MDIFKKILVLVVALGILSALFFVGIAFFGVVLILFPIIYFYQRYKMRDFFAEASKAQAAQQEKRDQTEEIGESKIIEADYEIIREEKK